VDERITTTLDNVKYSLDPEKELRRVLTVSINDVLLDLYRKKREYTVSIPIENLDSYPEYTYSFSRDKNITYITTLIYTNTHHT